MHSETEQQQKKHGGIGDRFDDSVDVPGEVPANEHVEESHRAMMTDQERTRYDSRNWQRREDLDDLDGNGPAQVRRVESILSREQHYEETADAIRHMPRTFTTDELNETAKKIVDPLLDLLNVVDTESKEQFPLRLLLDEVIELHVHFPGGHFTTFGRVSLVEATPCLWVDKCCLPTNALVRRESVGKAFVYDYDDQD